MSYTAMRARRGFARVVGGFGCTSKVARAVCFATAVAIGTTPVLGAFNLYVSSNGGIRAFDQTGAPLAGFASIPTGGNLLGPQGVAIGPDGMLYVAGQDSANILRYNASTGAFVDQLISLPGRDPEGLTFGPDTNGDSLPDLYVSNYSTNDVSVIPTAGTNAGVLTEYATTDMVNPIQALWHTDGKLYVASRGTHQIQRYNADGSFESTFAGATLSPGGLAFSADGSQFFTANTFPSNTSIDLYDSSGGLVTQGYVSGLTGGPKGMQIGPDGNLYVADTFGSSIVQIDPSTGSILDATFASLDGAFPRFLAWHEVEGTPTLPGDHNGDGKVDAADYVLWRKLGLPAQGYTDWVTHYGESNLGSGGGASAGAVPEPANAVILGIAALHCCLVSSRSVRRR